MIKLNLTPTINLQRPNKDGLCAIRIRRTVKRKVTYFPTAIAVLPEQFENKMIVKHPNKVHFNAAIRKLIVDIERLNIEENVLNINGGDDPLFFPYAENKIEKEKTRNSKGTWKYKRTYLKKLMEFKRQLRFSDFTAAFMLDYENHCRQKGNKPTTVWSSIKFIKTIINAAVREGAISKNPMAGYAARPYVNPPREFLTDKELERIEIFADTSSDETLVKVANWFLFACYSSLRYGDVKNFSPANIKNNRLILRTSKSLKDVSIKLHPRLKKIIPKLHPDVYSNQPLNDYLKIMAAKCKINKKISFHTARHTFAIYWLNNDGDIESLSELLGHSNLKTTKIYGKITNLRIDKKVEKVWGKARN